MAALNRLDLRTYLQDVHYDAVGAKDVRVHNRVIDSALERIQSLRDWRFYRKRGRITMLAVDVPATSTIDATQSSGTAKLLLAAAFFPTVGHDVADGAGWTLEFGTDNADHGIATFAVNGADIDITFVAGEFYEGTTVVGGVYRMYKWLYALPSDLQRLTRVLGQNLLYSLTMVDLDFIDFQRMQGPRFPSTPTWIAVHRKRLHLWPPFSDINPKILEVPYQRFVDLPTDDVTDIDWDDTENKLLFRVLDAEMAAELKQDREAAEVILQRALGEADDARYVGEIEATPGRMEGAGDGGTEILRSYETYGIRVL